MRVLENINPKDVMFYFEDICNIPHGSGDTDKISEYCVAFAKEKNLEYIKDDANNVIIKKPASTGFEGKSPVILQAHLDMVCEKEPDCNINFKTDPLEIMVDGDFITANGTTLGGDDGIGVAMIMAVLADNSLCHPPIEAVFTTDEETGMFGAAALDGSLLKGRTMMNLDSEAEGVLTVSCAGGARCEIRIPAKKTPLKNPCYEIIIDGLKGGHSGVEIHKGRHNSNILMGKLLSQIKDEYSVVEISGGSKDNAIPARSVVKISTAFNLEDLIADFENKNRTSEEPELKISLNKTDDKEYGFTVEDSLKITELLSTVPNGVQKMSEDIDGLVQTSLNLGILKTEDAGIYLTFSIRSSVNDEKFKLLKTLKALTAKFGGSFEDSSHYPAWEYKKDSHLREIMVGEYQKLTEKKPIVEAIHAGLECGLFSDKLPGLDAVSFGPDMEEIHTPNERLSISSVERSYLYLCKVLKALCR